MSERTIVKVVVSELTRYGYKDAEGYVSWSKNISENDKAAVVPGASFEGEYYISEKGTRYLNKIVARTSKVDAPKTLPVIATPSVDTQAAKRFTPSFKKTGDPSNAMSKVDWEAKDRSMMIGGLAHDAAVIAAQLVNVEGLNAETALATFKTLLEGMLKIREEVK